MIQYLLTANKKIAMVYMFFLHVLQEFFQIQSKFANDVEEMGMGNIEIMAFGKKTWNPVGFA